MTLSNEVHAAFLGSKLLARGPLEELLEVCLTSTAEQPAARLAIYNDETGRIRDVDLSGNIEEVSERLSQAERAVGLEPPPKRGRGRPKLGVVSREVSLLPRHWAWLGEQRGGASAALRRLVEGARKAETGEAKARRAVEAGHRFIWDIAGDAPHFEEVTRALFAMDLEAVGTLTAEWPEDVQDQLRRYTDRVSSAEAAR